MSAARWKTNEGWLDSDWLLVLLVHQFQMLGKSLSETERSNQLSRHTPAKILLIMIVMQIIIKPEVPSNHDDEDDEDDETNNNIYVRIVDDS